MHKSPGKLELIQGSGLLLALFTFFLLFALSLTGSHVGAGGKTGNGNSKAGEVLVKIKAGASSTDINQIEQDSDSDSDNELSKTDSGVIRHIHSRSKSTDELISQLRSNP